MKNCIRTQMTGSLESLFQTELPIADERQQSRFSSFLALANEVLRSKERLAMMKLSSTVASYSAQLENYIEILDKYNLQSLNVELKLETQPISYSLWVFEGNLKTLKGIGESIKKVFVSEALLNKAAKNLEAKEFDPG